MSPYRSEDELWRTVMKIQIEKFGDQVSKRWKSGVDALSECILCEEAGGGALIRCNNDKCNKYFHLDCACNSEGLSLSAEGILTYECESHFKPVIFCKCKTRYDNAKPMVYCDECFEWYHESCEKVSSKDLENLEKYSCVSCRALMKANKPIPASLKEKNLEKEAKSASDQNGTKVIGFLTQIAGTVCPVMDLLYGHITEEDEFTIEEVVSIVDYLSTLQAQHKTIESDEEVSNEEEAKLVDVRLVNQLGVLSLIFLWRQHAQSYLEQWRDWNNSILKTFRAFETRYQQTGHEFSAEFMGRIDQLLADFRVNEANGGGITANGNKNQNLAPYRSVLECLDWIKELLQALLTASKTDKWLPQLSATLRNVGSKSKKLYAFGNSDELCRQFAVFFQNFVKKASELYSKLSLWSSKASKLLNQQSELTMKQLEDFMNSANEMPVKPYLLEDIEELAVNGKAFEAEIGTFFAATSLDEDHLQKINEQREELGIITNYEESLLLLNRSMIYFKAYHLAFADGRIAASQLVSLLDEGKVIVELSASHEALVSSRLGFHVIEQVKRQLHKLEGYQQEAKSLLKQHENAFGSTLALTEINEIYKLLQQLTVILPEEEFLCFLRDGEVLSNEAKDVLSQRVSMELKEVELLMERMQTLVSNEVVDVFPQVGPIKAEYQKVQQSLANIYREADNHWTAVSSVLEDLDRGVAVSYEALTNVLQSAQSSNITNVDASRLAEEALATALVKEETISRQLAELAQPNVDMKSLLRDLHHDTHHFAIKSTLFAAVNRRIETCELMISCRALLDGKSSDVQELRDCRHSLFKLIQQYLQGDQTSAEYQMLMTVKDSFIEYSFLKEAVSILSGKQPISVYLTDKLLQKCAEEVPKLRSSTEYVSLQNELSKSKTCTDENKTLQDTLENLINSTTFTLNSMDTDGATGDSEKIYNFLQQINLGDLLTHEIFVQAIIPVLEQFKVSLDNLGHTMYALSVQVQTLVVAKEEETQKITENLGTVRTLYAVANLVCKLPTLLAGESQYLVPDHRDLLAYGSRMTTYQDKYNHTTPDVPANIIIYTLHIICKLINAEVGLWMERAQSTVPMRSVRNKSKHEARGVTVRDLKDLVDVSKHYIAYICKTAVHIRIEEIISAVEIIKQKLLSFLVNPTYMAEIPEGGEEALFKHIRSNLKDYLSVVSGMLSEIELLPVDLSEGVLVQWLNDLLCWLDSVPFPFEANKNVYEDDDVIVLTFEESLLKLQEGMLLVGQIPAPVVTELDRLHVIERNPATNAAVGLKKHVLPAIKWSGDVNTYLNKMSVMTKQYQQRVQLMIKTESSSLTPSVVQQLIEEGKRLVVQPDLRIKRELEKCLTLKPSSTGSKKSKVPALDEDGYFKAVDDAYAPSSLLPKPKIVKPVLVKAKCVLCNKEIKDKRDNYCSADCVYAYLPMLFQQYTSYKRTLADLNSLSITEKKVQAEGDYHAFHIKEKGNALASTPQPTQLPTACEESLLTKNIMSKLVNTTNDGLAVMRSKARASWEEFFTTLLPRLKIEGSSFLALLLANELEETSFIKYSGGDKIDVKEYKKHHQMLVMNLRQPHNEPLVRKLASGEMTMDALFSLSVQQLADTTQVQLRQKQLQGVVSGAQLVATEELLERKRRELMDGQESWRTKGSGGGGYGVGFNDVGVVKGDKTAGDGVAKEGNAGGLSIDTSLGGGDGAMETSEEAVVDGGQGSSSIGSPRASASNRGREIEARVLGGGGTGTSGKTSKRSLDVDEGSRFVSGTAPPRKMPKLEEDNFDGSIERTGSGDGSATSSPRASKAPSLLEILKTSANAEEPEEEEDEPLPPPRSKPPVSYLTNNPQPSPHSNHITYSPSLPQFLLYPRPPPTASASPTPDFSLTYPRKGGDGVYRIAGRGLVNDIRVMGQVTGKNTSNTATLDVSVDGRTRIQELERFLQEVFAQRKKVVATGVFMVADGAGTDAKDSPLARLEVELESGGRAGMCNCGVGVTMYLIPPPLKQHIQILRALPLPEGSTGHSFMYIVIVVKELGSGAMVGGNQSALPYHVSSFGLPMGNSGSPRAPDVPPPRFIPPAIPTIVPTSRPASYNPAPNIPTINPVPAQPLPSIMPLARPPPFVPPSYPGQVRNPVNMPPNAQPMPMPVPMQMPVPTQSVLSAVDMDKIRQVATFCAQKGVSKLQSLRENPSSRTTLPFLFEGNVGYE
eukprot:gene28529-34439_t